VRLKDVANARYDLAIVYEGMGCYDNALHHYKEALLLSPSSEKAAAIRKRVEEIRSSGR
jgi:regulator of sirC expression with transglutaminase-like and TPR domain